MHPKISSTKQTNKQIILGLLQIIILIYIVQHYLYIIKNSTVLFLGYFPGRMLCIYSKKMLQKKNGFYLIGASFKEATVTGPLLVFKILLFQVAVRDPSVLKPASILVRASLFFVLRTASGSPS